MDPVEAATKQADSLDLRGRESRSSNVRGGLELPRKPT
jgi:hypothetical protein